MAATKLISFLNGRGAKYIMLEHPPAATAREVADSAHVPGRDFAKTIIVERHGEMAMVVLPADRKILLPDLREMLGDHGLKLATEEAFTERFPDCELGAMPPFGNLYGLPVYVARCLAREPEIAFNAGTHREVIKMRYTDYDDLVHPTVMDFSTV